MLTRDIFTIETFDDFEKVSISLFRHQAANNSVYNKFLSYLNIDINSVKNSKEIPFLPIQFFKSHKIISSTDNVKLLFSSSGTTGNLTSTHYLTDVSLYEKSYLSTFEHFYEKISNYTVLALLPSYLERSDSSLVYMVNDLIKKSQKPKSGFYLDNLTELKNTLLELSAQKEKILLIGVSFALLDLIEQYSFKLNNAIIMETGGMKGRRKELIRDELHRELKKGFGVDSIHSEYGMTELLSQAYSKGDGIFKTPPWMKILIRDPENAMELLPNQKTGGINIIDLANINSCSFIATQDLGRTYADGSFEVLGRFDNSDIRGCNLLIN